jgi:PAS domain S-box-containing protein
MTRNTKGSKSVLAAQDAILAPAKGRARSRKLSASDESESMVHKTRIKKSDGDSTLRSETGISSDHFTRDGFIERMEALRLHFAIMNRDLVVQYISQAALARLPGFAGYQGVNLGKHPSSKPEMVERFNRTFETGTHQQFKNFVPNDPALPKSLDLNILPMGEEIGVFFSDGDTAYEGAKPSPLVEERFLKLSDFMSTALLIVNQEFKITYWNKRAEEITGLKHFETLGQRACDIFPEIPMETVEQLRTALRDSLPFWVPRFSYTDARISGVYGLRAFPIEGELAILIVDKTSHVEAEERLRAGEERFRTLSENLSLALILVDSDRSVTYFNRMCETILHPFSTDSVIGMDLLNILPIHEEALNELLGAAESTDQEVRRRIDSIGERKGRIFDLRAFPVGDEVGLIIEDVTLRVTQAAELDRSNRILLDLYNNAPCGYLSVLPNNTIEQMNYRMAEWLGSDSQDRFAGENISQVLSATSYDYFESVIRTSGLESPITNVELEFIKDSGEILIGLVNALPIFDPILKHWYWRWTVVDVTELRAAQHQIEDSRLFTQLFNELGEAVLISDNTGRIIRANKAAERILGLSIDELTKLQHDSDIWRTVLDDGTPVPIQNLPAVRVLREKQPVTNLEIGVMRPDGSLTWILESAAPLYDLQGEVTGVIVTFPEVTGTVTQRHALKELNDTLAIERDRANESNRLKSSFLANMSHEIRTPMTAILGFSDILSSELVDKVSDQHQSFLRSINISGKRLLSLINDILDLSKIEAGRLELQAENVDLMIEIESTMMPLKFIAKQKGLELILARAQEKLFIRADRQRIGQVIMNIVSNAIKFTRSGSVTVRLSRNDHDQALIEVIDTGIGIHPDFLPYLFEEFRQEHSGQTREFGGTGLGLAISNRLVTMMGGSISVDSKTGEGSTFNILFPLLRPGTEINRAQFAAPIFSKPKGERIATATAGRKRVLVVEDNLETQRLLDVYLRAEYEVSRAMNAAEAIAQLTVEVPDLILMDVNLPDKDGLAVTAEIRAGSVAPNVPIVALTAFAMLGDRKRCMDAGCNDYLSKPATKREVMEIVQKTLAANA